MGAYLEPELPKAAFGLHQGGGVQAWLETTIERLSLMPKMIRGCSKAVVPYFGE
jgi:hypothetical protein